MTDPRLDRRVQFDERSRGFGIKQHLMSKGASTMPRSYTWGCDLRTLDQGREGACVGFAWAGELSAKPKPIAGVTNEQALIIYRRAQVLDDYPGEDYSGTSVLAGVKVIKEQGYIKEYRWAFGVDDLALAVSRQGPAVLGIHWYSSMYQPVGGTITVSGEVVGGHAILCVGYNVVGRYFILQNSWGADWGIAARCRISYADMDTLLKDQGEACIPVIR